VRGGYVREQEGTGANRGVVLVVGHAANGGRGRAGSARDGRTSVWKEKEVVDPNASGLRKRSS
jgi:hypothetical protein